MIKIIILIPVFNDWESLKKLIFEINENIKHIKNTIFECIIVNDASTIPHGEIKKPIFLKSIKILNMKKIEDMQGVMLLASDTQLIMKSLII